MAFSGAFVKPFRPAFDAGLAAAAVPWYLAGGAPTPIAVYEPKGKASLAASYVNIVNPGTYNAAPGVAPTLDADGWAFNGTAYLNTQVMASTTHAVLIRFSNLATYAAYGMFGFINNGEPFLTTYNSNGRFIWGNGTGKTGTTVSSGVAGIAGGEGYLNGSLNVSSIPPGSVLGDFGYPYFIGRPNLLGNPFASATSKIQAVTIWNTSTGHATWMPAVMAAVALI